METTVEPSTTMSWTVLRRFKSRNKSERGRVMFVPRLSRYFNSLFLSLSRSLRSKRRKKNCNYGWRLIYIYSFLSLSCIPYIERIVRDDLLFGKNIGGAPTDYSLPNTCVARQLESRRTADVYAFIEKRKENVKLKRIYGRYGIFIQIE